MRHLIQFCVLALAGADLVEANSLVFVHVLWRHGDRTPIYDIPTDTANAWTTWKEGPRQLTSLGLKQHYQLGSYLRRRYVGSKFLDDQYPNDKVFVISSNHRRTITSAKANLVGLFRLSDEIGVEKAVQTLSSSAVNVISPDTKYVIEVMDASNCPTWKAVERDIKKTDYFIKRDRESKEFIRYLSTATGRHMSSFYEIGSVFDPLNCEKAHNRTWPRWVTSEIFERVKSLYDQSYVAGYDVPKLQRLKGGLLFLEIASRFFAKATGTLKPSNLKYYAYSGHDQTIAQLLKNFGAFDGHVPPYAAAVLIELHYTTDKRYVIKAFHINETGSQNPVPLTIANCDGGLECDLNTFVNLAQQSAPTSWQAECYGK